jgi:hypothetical protein
MRNRALATRLFFVLSTVSALAVWAACGDDSSSTIPPGTDAGGNDSGNNNNNDKDTGDNGPTDTGPKDTGAKDTGPKEAGPVYDAGDKIVLDSGYVDGGVECYVGSDLEEEPNDSKALANPIRRPEAGTGRPGKCGFIQVADAGPDSDGGEDDWLSFQLADAATGFYVKYEGNVRVWVETDGQAPADITATPSPTLVFAKGQDYYVRVRSANGTPATWKIILFEEP